MSFWGRATEPQKDHHLAMSHGSQYTNTAHHAMLLLSVTKRQFLRKLMGLLNWIFFADRCICKECNYRLVCDQNVTCCSSQLVLSLDRATGTRTHLAFGSVDSSPLGPVQTQDQPRYQHVTYKLACNKNTNMTFPGLEFMFGEGIIRVFSILC